MRIPVGLALLPGLLCAALIVPTRAASAELKIAFVDQRKAIISSAKGKEAETALKALAEKKRGDLEPQAEEIQRLREEFEAQRFVLSEQALEERRLELVKRTRDLEREQQEAQEALQIEERKMLQPLVKRFDRTVKALGKDGDWDIILDRSSPGVLFFQDGLDITDSVIEQLNED